MKQTSQTHYTTYILWAVFISLLLVLLPHTAWAFRNFEPAETDAFVLFSGNNIIFTTSDLVAYIGAFAFEAAIAVLVHKLAEHIGKKPPASAKKSALSLFAYRYLNPISFALVVTTGVSALANLAHAVQFGTSMKIFAEWGIPFAVYASAFGGILPLVSLTFARVLSNVVDDEAAPNPELTAANEQIRNLRQQLRESEVRAKSYEEKLRKAEDRFDALGDLVKMLFGEDKRQRILAAHQQWQDLPNKAIAIICGSSEAYVSEVLKDALPERV